MVDDVHAGFLSKYSTYGFPEVTDNGDVIHNITVNHFKYSLKNYIYGDDICIISWVNCFSNIFIILLDNYSLALCVKVVVVYYYIFYATFN